MIAYKDKPPFGAVGGNRNLVATAALLGIGLPALMTAKYPVWMEQEDPHNPKPIRLLRYGESEV